jgi:RNA polymerase sigma factor (TIGR02999 family)
MTPTSSNEIADLLRESGKGNREAVDRLVQVVYKDLCRLARHYMRGERPGHTLQTTALVNEAYLKLAHYEQMQWQDRSHFLAVAAQAMRRVLVDHARGRLYAKRGGAVPKVSIETAQFPGAEPVTDVLALDDALNSLETVDPRKCRIVELKFMAGLSIAETAKVLEISTATVEREWRSAKAWLYRIMTEGKDALGTSLPDLD